MEQLIKLDEYPVKKFLEALLQDKTTKKNIIWATAIEKNGSTIDPRTEITKGDLIGYDPFELQPRVYKSAEAQADRTKAKAEVFTPCWVVNKMNNHADFEWFGRESVFNTENEQSWDITEGKIEFPEGKTWKDYVISHRLEITCGEAPYLVSRYDTTTGEIIPVERRIGLLDRKLRVVGENTETEEEWLEWAVKAFQASYGYEYQGDSLLIARINLLITFVDYMNAKWGHNPTDAQLRKMVNIITWNIWQMDGLTGSVPFAKQVGDYEVQALDLFGDAPEEEEEAQPCRIYDWTANKSVLYNGLKNT